MPSLLLKRWVKSEDISRTDSLSHQKYDEIFFSSFPAEKNTFSVTVTQNLGETLQTRVEKKK